MKIEKCEHCGATPGTTPGCFMCFEKVDAARVATEKDRDGWMRAVEQEHAFINAIIAALGGDGSQAMTDEEWVKWAQERVAWAKRAFTAEATVDERDAIIGRLTKERDDLNEHIEGAIKHHESMRQEIAELESALQNMLKRAQEAEARAEDAEDALQPVVRSHRNALASLIQAQKDAHRFMEECSQQVARAEAAEGRERGLRALLQKASGLADLGAEAALAEDHGHSSISHELHNKTEAIESEIRTALATPAPAEATGGPTREQTLEAHVQELREDASHAREVFRAERDALEAERDNARELFNIAGKRVDVLAKERDAAEAALAQARERVAAFMKSHDKFTLMATADVGYGSAWDEALDYDQMHGVARLRDWLATFATPAPEPASERALTPGLDLRSVFPPKPARDSGGDK
jgi:chromosome segregation ATPase